MKVFVSWSGELSQKIAKELSEWLPSIIQSIEVFYSPEDIRKGENWDSRLSNELQDSKYGIVCLTPENVSAPWIHFEAGALSKTLDSRVSTLMINIVPSEIQGPLSRFQATKLEKDDFYQLLVSVNEASDNPISDKVLRKSFDAIWEKMRENIDKIVSEITDQKEELSKKNKDVNDVLEELLQLVRKQDAIINNPEKLLPIAYLEYVSREITTYGVRVEEIIDRMANELKHLYETGEERKHAVSECYRLLIVLAEQTQCDRAFVHYLQKNYLQIEKDIVRKIKINRAIVEKEEKATE